MPSPLRTPPEFLDPALPTVPVEQVPACVTCGGAPRPFAAGFDYELRTCRDPWQFVECEGCGHVWLHPRPAVSALGTIYPPSYYAYNYADTVHPFALKAKSWLDRRKFAGILKHLPRAVRGYADIGCGDGRFLDLMHGRGVPKETAYGLELDAATVARVRARGYRGIQSRVEECTDIPAGSLDLVTMFHVIEHVADPVAVVRRLAEWTAPGGIVALETPNLDSLDARLFRDTWWGGYHIPRHWHLFTPRTLGRILREAGLTPLAVQYQTGHSFWMYSFHHRLRYGTPPRPGLARRFDPFGGSVLALGAATLFDKLRAALGSRTSAMLVIARK